MYNETYEEYIRSILGYPPINPYENNFQDYRNQNMNFDYNSTSNMNINSINTASDMELENCYPEIYKIVYPMITKKCDNIRGTVTNEDIQNITDEIYYALEEKSEVKLNINLTNEVRGSTNNNVSKVADKKPEVKISETSKDTRETRQFNSGLRDLIQILLIRELLRRRRRPGSPPSPYPPMPGPRPPMRPPFRPGFGTEETTFNRDFELSNYNIFEN